MDGTATEYRMAGDLLVSEKTGTQTYWYRYDSGANLVSVTIGGEIYFYVRNAQNDVIALIDGEGNTVVKYTYDSWGKVLGITGSLADTVGVQNPFRYRGYYYDSETGMYYLKSRYYDPNIRRFLCSDEMSTVKASMETMHNRNLYAYCNQNPVVREDRKGTIWAAVIGALVGIAVSVGTQMIFEGKSITEIDLLDVGSAAISGAVATTGLGIGWQMAINGGVSGSVSIIQGDDDWREVLLDVGIGAASGAIGGSGANFAGHHKEYLEKMAYYSAKAIDNSTRAALKNSLKRSYIRTTGRRVSLTAARGIGGYGVSKSLSNTTDVYGYSPQYLKSLIVNYDQNRGYVPCHPQITNHPLYN